MSEVSSATPGSASFSCAAARWALAGRPLTVVSLDDPAGRRLARRLGARAFAYSDGRAQADLTVNVVSFGFKHGLPMEADLVFDVRFMPNPYYIEALRDKTGLDEEVYRYVFSFPQTRAFMERLENLLDFLLPYYKEEGKAVLVVAIGCTGGHHRSVAVTRALVEHLQSLGCRVTENHRDMTRN